LLWFWVVLGLAVLILSGDALVKGAVNLSLRLGIPALIVSLTIVAFGTSAPELIISINAVLEGAAGLAMGNVVGSNIANILLVLGVPAIVATLETGAHDTKKSYKFMLLASVLFVGLAFWGPFSWQSGLILLTALVFTLGDTLRDALRHSQPDASEAQARAPSDAAGPATTAQEERLTEGDTMMPWPQIVLFLALGMIGLPLGAHILVDSATQIAQQFGISDAVIGLTLVALGTSLPELATTVMAALRRQADVALGNVIGSNIFNLLAIMGLTSLVGPVPVDSGFLQFDLWVMLAASALLIPFVFFGWNITRIFGLGLTALYLLYVSIVLM
jgi:cation:H+ antiporter